MRPSLISRSCQGHAVSIPLVTGRKALRGEGESSPEDRQGIGQGGEDLSPGGHRQH